MDSLLGTLFINLTAQNTQFIKNVKESQEAMSKASESIVKSAEFVKKSLELLGVAFGLNEIREFVKGALEGVDALNKFSEQVGASIDRMGELKFAAEKANVGEEFEQGFRKFAQSMRESQVEGSKLQMVFEKLGITEREDVVKAFYQSADAFKSYQDGVNKLGMAQEIYGTRNSRFVNLVNQGSEGLKEQGRQFQQLSGVDMKEAAEAVDKYNDSMTELRTMLKGLAIIFAEEFLPQLRAINKDITDHHDDYVVFAKDLGVIVGVIAEKIIPAFKDLLGVMELVDSGFLSLVGFAGKAASAISGFFAPNSAVDKAFKATAAEVNASAYNAAAKANELFGGSHSVTRQNPVAEKVTSDLEAINKALQEGHKKLDKSVEELDRDRQDIQRILGQDKGGRGGFEKDTLGAAKQDLARTLDIPGLSDFTQNASEQKSNQARITELKRLANTEYGMRKENHDKLLELEKLYAAKEIALRQQQTKLILSTMQTMNDSILEITEAFGGKQTGIYSAMFAASKAFAIAEATVKIAQGLAEAASEPWPANLAAMASVAAATATIVSSIQAVKLQFAGGKAMGGPVDANKMFMVGERGPELFVPSASGNIVPNNRLGGQTQVVIHNHTDAEPSVSERDDGDGKVIEVMMRRIKRDLSGEIRNGQGDVSRALESAFSLRRGTK